MSKNAFYVTTAIMYPNAAPHMGTALEWVQADVIARYMRTFGGMPVCFQTGVDEYGQKNFKAAAADGRPPREFVDAQYPLFASTVDALSISYDRFIRTTDDDHRQMAQALWNACASRGDIYKKTYRAWYNVKEEEFLGSADEIPDPAVFGVDPKFIELIEEENYFFAASKYQDEVIRRLESDEYAVVPANRKLELINFAREKGIQDVSISRDVRKMSWGLPVPGDDSQVMYVWFDALTNYLTGSATVVDGVIVPGEFWPASLHIVGKDIARFHGLLWPAMLLSAGLPLPEKLLVHGFILSNGRKMSKSIGNVVDPRDMIEKYGSEALRWYLSHAIPTQDDGDFTEERFRAVYMSDLANDYGNLVSRVVSMAHKYCGGVPNVTAEQVDNLERVLVEEKWREYHEAMRSLKVNDATAAAQALMVFCNRRIDELKPWVLAKDENLRSDLDKLLYELLETIRHISLMLSPVLPKTVERLMVDVYTTVPSELWSHAGQVWGGLVPGSELGQPYPLFPRLEP
jgi:methionyl-tRNA synthetase